MHSSAYIKPFEEEMKSWEDKLISMQDILDAWLRCQESWLYLEPIFNSEDIMKQMPVEGRKFNKVDRIWRNIMAKTVADPRYVDNFIHLFVHIGKSPVVSFHGITLPHSYFKVIRILATI